ncbi:MAG TPA: methyltransferase domain-containing protein [Chloroflexia bacterium]|nr:methyltransferase domain-containing protein [Chloroflexia bacterium]
MTGTETQSTTNTTSNSLQHTVAEHYDKVWTEQESESWESWPFFQQSPSALTTALDSLGKVRGKRVLDLACGVGYSSKALAERGAQVFSVDLSSQGLLKTLTRARQAKLAGQVIATRSSVEQLPFADESFDAVFAQNFLMHVSAESVGREVWRVLKPGGKAVFVEPLAHHPLVKLYRTLFSSYKGTKPRWSSRDDLKTLATPFRQVETRGFYLSSALASVNFVQQRPFLLKPAFATLNGLDTLLVKIAPRAERYSWVAVTILSK